MTLHNPTKPDPRKEITKEILWGFSSIILNILLGCQIGSSMSCPCATPPPLRPVTKSILDGANLPNAENYNNQLLQTYHRKYPFRFIHGSKCFKFANFILNIENVLIRSTTTDCPSVNLMACNSCGRAHVMKPNNWLTTTTKSTCL